MRTKTLLLTAALSAAGVAASMAQVYSVNVVGYVNVSVPAGGWAILSNPLQNTDNSMANILQMPSGSSGVLIFQWDPQVQNFKDSVTYIEGVGWLSASDPNPTINPGEGFFIQNPNATALNLTFVGEVLQGPTSVSIAAKNGWSLIGSKVPMAAPLGTATDNTTLQYPATDQDLVFVWDSTIQNYKDSYTYLDAVGGWLSASDPNMSGPVVGVATGFWLQRAAATGPNWDRNFQVQ